MIRWIGFLGSALFVLTLVGCICWPTRVEDAPLAPEEESRLEALLVGTWSAAAFEDRRGNIDENDPEHFLYHFQEDGTGRYDQNYMVTGRNPFRWELRGRNIHLFMERGGRESVWRIDEYNQDSMRWFNYFDSGYFLMERQQ